MSKYYKSKIYNYKIINYKKKLHVYKPKYLFISTDKKNTIFSYAIS